MESPHFPSYHSPVDIHLLGKGHPAHCVDPCYGRGWDVQEGRTLSCGMPPMPSTLRYHWGLPGLKTAVSPRSRSLPRWSQPMTNKSPALFSYLRWFWRVIQLLELLRDSVKASVDTVSLFDFCQTLFFYSPFSSPGVDHSLTNFTYHSP